MISVGTVVSGRCSAKSSPWAWIRSIRVFARAPVRLPRAAAVRRAALAVGDVRRQLRGRDQAAGDKRTFRGDDERAMPGGNQGPVQCRENLLGAADRVGTDRRQRVTDAEDRERPVQLSLRAHGSALCAARGQAPRSDLAARRDCFVAALLAP